MGILEFLLAIIVFTLMGCMAGIVTGLVPGIHVNNVAYIALSFQSALLSFTMLLFGWAQPTASELIIIVCSLVIGNAITHTFLDFIPSVFLGAPDGETALSLLPGHRMVLAGRGYEAVKCSVIGSFGAVIGALIMLVPMRLIVGSPVNAYEAFAAWMHLLLICVAIFLIMTERARPDDAYPKKRRFEMRGHCILGNLAPGDVAQSGQAVMSLAELGQGCAGTVAVSARVANKFSESGARLLQLEDDGNTMLMELMDVPQLEPEIGEPVVAIGTLKRVMTWRDHATKRAMAAGVFLLSGLLGISLLSMPGTASQNIFFLNIQSADQGTVLFFPLFTGLFGVSTLLLSLKDNPRIPEQNLDRVKVKLTYAQQTKAIGSGCVASTASWFPGISGAVSTLFSVFLTHPDDSESKDSDSETQSFIISVSAVNTAVALFNLVALFVILKSRSGAMKAVETIISSDLVAWEPFETVPSALAALLLSALVAAIVSVPLALFFGKFFARHCSNINYKLLVKGVIVFLLAMVVMFSGALGLAILGVSTCLGIIPPLIGVKRVHLMGCLIIPVILFFL